MTQSTTTETTPPNAPQVRLCDDCAERAVAAYRWEWGAEGLCCAHHQFLHRQKATTLNRSIEFKPLPDVPPASLTRDERQRFYAQVLALEDEVRDVKSRGSELYQSNTKLAEECRRLTARNRELEAQLKDASGDLKQAQNERDAHAANLHQVTDELQRLRGIESAIALTANEQLAEHERLNAEAKAITERTMPVHPADPPKQPPPQGGQQ